MVFSHIVIVLTDQFLFNDLSSKSIRIEIKYNLRKTNILEGANFVTVVLKRLGLRDKL